MFEEGFAKTSLRYSGPVCKSFNAGRLDSDSPNRYKNPYTEILFQGLGRNKFKPDKDMQRSLEYCPFLIQPGSYNDCPFDRSHFFKKSKLHFIILQFK